MKRLWSALMCVCLMLTGCGRGEYEMHEELEAMPLIPDHQPTHEESAENALKLCGSAQDSCAMMLEEARARGAQAEALAEEARAKYEPRLAELAEMDYVAMTDDEIMTYMIEISDIISGLRETRDAIDALR